MSMIVPITVSQAWLQCVQLLRSIRWGFQPEITVEKNPQLRNWKEKPGVLVKNPEISPIF